MKPIDYIVWFAAGAFPVVVTAWYFDHAKLSRRALEAECKFEAIDPIRVEAGVPLSECCKELLRGNR